MQPTPLSSTRQPVHGRADKQFGRHAATARGGQMRRVVDDAPRMDLRIADLWRGIWRDWWEFDLADGSRLLVYHDLTHGGWWEADEDDLPGPELLARVDLEAIERDRIQARAEMEARYLERRARR